MYIARPAMLFVSNSLAFNGVASLLSTITKCGWRCTLVSASMCRTFSKGSSCNTVPMPVSTAQERARQACPSARAASPVIHWLLPSASAVCPSKDAATFIRTQGVLRTMRLKKPIFNSREATASALSTGKTSTVIPASRSICTPRPDTSGLGSKIATTTLPTLASINALQQGGVRP